jgi:hypothetical protein
MPVKSATKRRCFFGFFAENGLADTARKNEQ